MSSPYGPPGPNDPATGGDPYGNPGPWGQPPQPHYGGSPAPGPGQQSGAAPAQPYPGGYPPPPPAGYGQPPTGYPPQPHYPQTPPGGGYPQRSAYGPPGQQAGRLPAGQPYPGGYPQQPGYGPGGQQAPPGFDEKDSAGKHTSLIWGLVAAAVLVVAVIVVGGFAWPGWWISKVFDSSRVESGVQKILTNNYKLDNVTGVSCPADQEVTPGHTFSCAVTVDGKQRTVKITVKDSEGKYEVSQPK